MLLVSYNLEAARNVYINLIYKLPDISSSLTGFAEKYGISNALQRVLDIAKEFKRVFVEVRYAALWPSEELSELSKLFRNVVVAYQKNIQVLIDAVINLLRETKYKLPGMDEATLPEICMKIKIIIAEMLEKLANNMEIYFSPIMENINTVEMKFPSGKVITVAEVQENVRSNLKNFLSMMADMMKQMESLDGFLEKLGEIIQEAVEEAQLFVDGMKFNILEAIAAPLNAFYKKFLKSLDEIEGVLAFGVMFPLGQLLNHLATQFEEVINANNGIQQIELPYPFFL